MQDRGLGFPGPMGWQGYSYEVGAWEGAGGLEGRENMGVHYNGVGCSMIAFFFSTMASPDWAMEALTAGGGPQCVI